jgi:ABC-type branched-subunit amino acid transport system substrate-binding protein
MLKSLRRSCAAILALSWITPGMAHGAEVCVAQVAPFSGGLAVYSNEIKLGASVMFDAANARGGVNGNKIRLVTRDDSNDPAQTVSQFEELARVERPVAFLFPVGPLSIAALLDRKVPERIGTSLIGTVPALYKLRSPVNPFVFHVGLGDDAELVKIVEHVSTLGIKHIGVVFWNEPSALDALALIEREARARGMNVGMKVPVEAGTDKVAAAVATTIREVPGTVIALLPVHATGALVKGLREARNSTTVYGPSYTESFLLAQVAGAPRAVGVGVSQVVPNPYSGNSPLVREYQQHIRQYGPPGSRFSTLSLQGYLAARIVVEGLRRSGPTPTAASVRNAIENLHDVDLGGLTLNYGPLQHVGLRFLDIGVVSDEGRLRY